MKEKTYRFGKSKLTLKFGDITATETQVIVSSDDYYLSMGGGVSASILKAGGNEIAIDAAKQVPAKLGDVVITTAGRLKSKFVFHAVTIGIVRDEQSPKEIIKSTTTKCLSLLNSLSLNSISFPTIGAGSAGFSYEDIAIEMSKIISEYLSKAESEYEVIIYLFDRFGRMEPSDYIIFFEAFAAKVPQFAKNEIKESPEVTAVEHKLKLSAEETKEEIKLDAEEAEREIKAKRLHHLRKFLASLEDQRNRLEEKLIDLLENSASEEYLAIENKLKQNGKLRLTRLKELKDLTENTSESKHKSNTPTIFLSSTYSDLIEYRKAIKEQIARRRMIFIGMEHFGAYPENRPPASIIIEEVKKADVYIGVFGVRYGYIDQVTGLSMTELEYREAKSNDKPMFLYVIKETANIKVSDIEKDSIGREKLETLKTEIMTNKVVYKFDSIADLERQVYADLEKV
jgi:O-acetyl-ADP-ribose deacetylase (regulator of RNase III)